MTVSTVGWWRISPAHLRATAVGVLGLTAAVVTRSPMLLVFAAPFALVAVWSSAERPRSAPRLAASIAPGTVREGEATTWTARLSSDANVDHLVVFAPERAWLETRPRSGVLVTTVDNSEPETVVALPMRATRWGRHLVGPINLVAVSSWGAYRWTAHDVGHRVTALPLPEVFDASPAALRANGLVGLNRSSHPGDGNEFSGIRPFQTGDRLRRINWQRSLRSNELHVTATYADQDSHVALFVDALADVGSAGGIDGESSSLDTTIRAAGAIAEYFLRRGDRVSLRVWDSSFHSTIPPGSGSGHLRRILEVLASIEPGMNRLGAKMGNHSTVSGDALAIMLSPLISPLALERAVTIVSHGLDVAVIDTLPEDVNVENDATTELAWRIRLLERRREVRAVQRAGVPVIAWRGPGSLDPFLREVARRASAPRMARR